MKKLILLFFALCFSMGVQIYYPKTSSQDISIPGVLPSWVVTQNYQGGQFTVGTVISTDPAVGFIGGNGLPASSGQTQIAILRLQPVSGLTTAYLDFGVQNSSGKSWLQAYNGALNLNGSILLNPNGGNVGIGTTAPLALLQVNGNVSLNAVDPNLGLVSSVTNHPLFFELRQNNQIWQLGQNRDVSNMFSIYDLTNGQHALTILPTTRYVGIGTTSPRTLLDAVGTVSASALVVNGLMTQQGSSVFNSIANTDTALKTYSNSVDDGLFIQTSRLTAESYLTRTKISAMGKNTDGSNGGSQIEFYTQPKSGAFLPLPAMTIDKTQVVSVNQLNVNGAISATSINASSQPYFLVNMGPSTLPAPLGTGVITFNARIQDASQVITYNTLTGVGTILQSGIYLFDYQLGFLTSAAAGYIEGYLQIKNNHNMVHQINQTAVASTWEFGRSSFIPMNSGDTFTMKYNTNIPSMTLVNGGTTSSSTWLRVLKLF